jgi:predicted RNase H-like HicB family nuclease
MKLYNYTVVFEPVPEGGYNVVVPAIPEIVTFGETLEEAKANAREAISSYLESAVKAKESIPKDRKPAIEKIAIEM